MVANIEQDAVDRDQHREGRAAVGLQDRLGVRLVGGGHISSQNSRGVVAVSGHRRGLQGGHRPRHGSRARAVQVPSNREILHVIPRGYIVDGQEGIKDPLGMSAVRLEVETHIVAGASTSLQNLQVRQLGRGQIDELVIASLAAAEAT